MHPKWHDTKRQVRPLRLPGDPMEAQKRAEIREAFKEGKGLNPLELSVLDTNEELNENIAERKKYTPSSGRDALDKNLKQLEAEQKRVSSNTSTKPIPISKVAVQEVNENDRAEDESSLHQQKTAKRPPIRRIITQPKRSEAEEEAATVFLSLTASQNEPVTGTAAGPAIEPAVSLATQKIPRIHDDMLKDYDASDELAETAEADEQAELSKKGKSKNLDHLTISTMILVIGHVLSKLTGQIRQILYPHVFVEKYLTDAYVQGFLIPDFIYELLIGGSIQAAIVPTLAAALGTDKEKETWQSVSIFISFVSLVMLVFLGIAEIFAPQLLAPFVKAENLELTSQMARVLFPQTFFMMCAALAIGIVNAHSNFIKTTFGPAIYNSLFALSLILFGAPNSQALIHVGIGVSLSALAYFLFQYFMGRREIAPFKFMINLRDKGFQRILLLAIPILFSSSIAHVNTMVLHGFTKSMESGAATALNQANSVWLLPYGIFTVAIGQAMLPTLSTMIGRKQNAKASTVFSVSIKRMLFFAIPSAVFFYLLREDLMLGIYIWRFDGYDAQIEVTKLAARLLQWYCISIIFQGFIYLYNYAFYAMKVTYLPLLNGILSLIITLVVGSYITRPDVLGAEGLSVSYAISGVLTALILTILFKIRFPEVAPHYFQRDSLIFVLKLIPMIVLSAGSILLLEHFIKVPSLSNKLLQLVWLGVRFIVAFGIWFILGRLLKIDLSLPVEVQTAGEDDD